MSNVNYKSDQVFLYWDENIFTNSNSNQDDSTTFDHRNKNSIPEQMQDRRDEEHE